MILVERNAKLGGRTALLYRYFPKMCHPTCGLEINLRRLKGAARARDDDGAEMTVTPCQLCQANVEVYQSEINKKKGTKLAMPVVYYSQLKAVAW